MGRLVISKKLCESRLILMKVLLAPLLTFRLSRVRKSSCNLKMARLAMKKQIQMTQPNLSKRTKKTEYPRRTLIN